MPLNPGDIVNHRYRVVMQLGFGGFGAVYRVQDMSLKTDCALKENLDYWDEAQRQFEQEAVLLANLRHPNLPRVTDYFAVPAQGQYLVMDFVEGYDLQTIIDRIRQPLLESKVLGWMEQVCDALAYLHTQEPPVIHRDIKPANIKINSSGRAMLVDFGIAKKYSPGAKTNSAARAVTIGFSPVEQYGEGITDSRTDIYALGATLYSLLTAQRPPESIARVTGEVLIPPREINPKISPQVEAAIIRAMEVQAPDRFPGVDKFWEALEKPAEPAATDGEWVVPQQIRDRISSQPPGTGKTPPGLDTVPGRQPSVQDSAPAAKITITRARPSSRPAAVRMEWVTIPGGKFLYGEEKKVVKLPAFQIARFPVTNLQYQHFLDAYPGHPAPAYWKGGRISLRKQRHPVVGVSLHDALTFCKWLGARLPAEEEWEKAARGEDGRIFPWKDDWKDGKYCNNWDARIGGTTPVDRYEVGISPYGVWDLVGNVWEWTDSEYQGPLMHVLRGGSWRLFSKFAMRVTERDWLTLDDSRDDLGFRCARSL